MIRSFTFEGFDELLRKPLDISDPRSFDLVCNLLHRTPQPPSNPFGYLIEMLSGVTISHHEARSHWKNILAHKRRLELKLRRTVHIKTAVVDYYVELGVDSPPTPPGAVKTVAVKPAPAHETMTANLTNTTTVAPEQAIAPGVYQDRLKTELLRMRRYKHALSVLLFDADLTAIPPQNAERVFDSIVTTISKAVRIVDIPIQYSADLFLLILPNTNRREAMELAGRLKTNIHQRTSRIPGLANGIPAAIAVGQCSKDDTANEYIKRLEQLIRTGKRTTPAAIYTLD